MKYFFATLFAFSVVATANSQELYAPDNITQIELTFEESNWDQLLDNLYSAGEDRLEGTAVINGETFEQVGVKYKGNSTYNANNDKNPMNIKLNYILDQDYDGYYTMKLSSGDKDPSYVREVLTYDVIGKYMDAPLANYAQVYVNGNYHGLYMSIEAVNKKFVEEKFYSDNDNPLVKCNPESVFGGGSSTGCAESNNSSLEYLGADSACYYEYYEMMSDYGWDKLQELTADIQNDTENLEDYIDIDRFIWMSAANSVMVNLDSYTGPFVQNYYLFEDDHGVFDAVMWDFNQSFGSFSMINGGGGGPGSQTSNEDLQEMDPLMRQGDDEWPMLDIILGDDTYLKMYIAHCKTMLLENFDNEWYVDVAENYQDLIEDAVSDDPNAIYTVANMTNNLTDSYSAGGFPPSNYIGVVQLMEARNDYLLGHELFLPEGPVISDIDAPETSSNYSSVSITASISDADYAFLGYRKSERDHFQKTEMFDDGAHDDGAADDGVYGASITLEASDIQYYIYAEDSDAGKFSPVRAEHEFYSLAVSGDLVINEIQASNKTTEVDEMGEFDDWIELFNNTGSAINLSGYYLTDEDWNLTKWALPSVEIAANDFAIVWADEDQDQGEMHCNFKLQSEGELLLLVNADLEIVDELFFPVQTSDLTWGRYPNGTGAFQQLGPTFDDFNSTFIGINDIENEATAFEIFPNPTDEYFYIQTGDSRSVSMEIYNSLGGLIDSKVVRPMESIYTGNLEAGLYLVKIDGQSIKKLLIQ